MMKTKPIIVILLVFLSMKSEAQFYNSAEVDGSTYYYTSQQHTITLPWTDKYVVHVTPTRISVIRHQYFSLQLASPYPFLPPPSFETQYLDLPSSVTITDAKILGDSLYFCGRITGSTTSDGVIGYVNLNTLGTSTPPTIDYYSVTDIPLKKILVHRNHVGIISLVAAGTDVSAVPSNYQNMLIHISNLNAVVFSYKKIDLQHLEDVDELLLTGNRFVTVSHTSTSIFIRRTTISDLPYNGLTTVSEIPLPANELNGSIYASLRNDTTLAIAYVSLDNTGGELAIVREFHSILLNNTYSVKIPLKSKNEPLSLCSLPRANNLVLLQPNFDDTMGYRTDVYMLYRNNNPTMPPSCSYYKHLQQWFTSAGRVMSKYLTGGGYQEVLLLSGSNKWYWYNTYCSSSGLNSAFYCNKPKAHVASIIPNLTKLLNSFLVNVSSPEYPTKSSILSSWLTMTPSVGCYSFQ